MTSYANLPYDILHLICLASENCSLFSKDLSTVLSLSLLDRRTREAAIPTLFRSISFKPAWSNTSEEYLDELLDVISQNSLILRAVRKVTINVYFSTTAPVQQLPAKLGTLLLELPNLMDLCMNTPFPNGIWVAEILQAPTDGEPNSVNTVIKFPSMQFLTFQDDQWQFLAQHCPGLRGLSVKTSYTWRTPQSLVDIAALSKTNPQLRTLNYHRICDRKFLEELASHLPLVESLGCSKGYSRLTERGSILDHILYLNGLKKLKLLRLPNLQFLGLGFEPPHPHSYRNNPGLSEEVEQKKQNCLRRLTDVIETYLASSPHSVLQTIRIGNYWDSRTIEVGEDKSLRIINSYDC